MAIDPMTAIAVIDTGLKFLDSGRQAAEQQQRYLDNRIRAAAARDLKIQALNTRAIQEAERASGAKLENLVSALRVRESKVVAAGEAGVEGQGVEALLADTEARRLRGDTIYNEQLKNTLQQINLEKQGIDAQTIARIESVEQGRKPSALGMLVEASMKAYATERKYGGNKKGSFLATIGLGGDDPGIPTIGQQGLPSVVPMGGGDSTYFGGT
jgi:hypothetical protein